MTIAAGGCTSRPNEQDLRAALITQIEEDNARYNQRMDRYGAPRMGMDGSSFTVTRSHVKLAVKTAQIRIRETGGRTTLYEAEVPQTIETYIKSGPTEQACLDAPERKLEPQRVTHKYEYTSLTYKWHRT